jgi:hypothetical protein
MSGAASFDPTSVGSDPFAAALPAGPCPRCEREVLAYAIPGENDEETWLCVHCDGPLSGIDFFSEGDLERLGYDLRDPLAAGCATGCASGGCATKPRTIDEILTRHRRL